MKVIRPTPQETNMNHQQTRRHILPTPDMETRTRPNSQPRQTFGREQAQMQRHQNNTEKDTQPIFIIVRTQKEDEQEQRNNKTKPATTYRGRYATNEEAKYQMLQMNTLRDEIEFYPRYRINTKETHQQRNTNEIYRPKSQIRVEQSQQLRDEIESYPKQTNKGNAIHQARYRNRAWESYNSHTSVQAINIPANGPFDSMFYYPGFNKIEMDNDQFRNESDKYRRYPGAPKEDEMYTLNKEDIEEWKKVEEYLPTYLRKIMKRPTVRGIEIKTAIARTINSGKVEQITQRILHYYQRNRQTTIIKQRPNQRETEQETNTTNYKTRTTQRKDTTIITNTNKETEENETETDETTEYVEPTTTTPTILTKRQLLSLPKAGKLKPIWYWETYKRIDLDDATFREQTEDYRQFPFNLSDHDIIKPRMKTIDEWNQYKEALPEYIRNVLPTNNSPTEAKELKTAIARTIAGGDMRTFTARIMHYHEIVNNTAPIIHTENTTQYNTPEPTRTQEKTEQTPTTEESEQTDETDTDTEKENKQTKQQKQKKKWTELPNTNTPLNHTKTGKPKPLQTRNT